MDNTCENCAKLKKGKPNRCMVRVIEINNPETETCGYFTPAYDRLKYPRKRYENIHIEASGFERRKTLAEVGIQQIPPQLIEANDDLALHAPQILGTGLGGSIQGQ